MQRLPDWAKLCDPTAKGVEAMSGMFTAYRVTWRGSPRGGTREALGALGGGGLGGLAAMRQLAGRRSGADRHGLRSP